MGIFDSIFGGGSKTTVKQTSTNVTNLDLTTQIANVLDVEALAEAVKAMGVSIQGAITGTGQQTQALLQGLAQGQQIGILAYLSDVQADMQRNELIKQGMAGAKVLLLAGGAYWAWRKFA